MSVGSLRWRPPHINRVHGGGFLCSETTCSEVFGRIAGFTRSTLTEDRTPRKQLPPHLIQTDGLKRFCAIPTQCRLCTK